MRRTLALQIRVNEQEMATFETMAQLEKLPVGTYVRRYLLLEAERRGIVPRYTEEVSEAKVQP